MLERFDHFATPILKVRVPDSEALNKALLESIDKKREEHPGVMRSNIGGWHSDTDMTFWGGAPARTLAEIAVQSVSGHMADISTGGKKNFHWDVEMWANVNTPGAANQLHCHPGSFWSGVYYADAGGAEAGDAGGELVLEDPRYPTAYMTFPDLVFKTVDGEPMTSQVPVTPEAGLMVLFPSWLRHSVRTHGGTRDRVSIALNLRLTAADLDTEPARH